MFYNYLKSIPEEYINGARYINVVESEPWWDFLFVLVWQASLIFLWARSMGQRVIFISFSILLMLTLYKVTMVNLHQHQNPPWIGTTSTLEFTWHPESLPLGVSMLLHTNRQSQTLCFRVITFYSSVRIGFIV